MDSSLDLSVPDLCPVFPSRRRRSRAPNSHCLCNVRPWLRQGLGCSRAEPRNIACCIPTAQPSPLNSTDRMGENKTCNYCWVCFSSHEHIPTSGAPLCPEGVCWWPACISRSCDSAAKPCCAWTPDAAKMVHRSETTTHRTDCTLPSRLKSVLDFCTVFAPVANRLLGSWPVYVRGGRPIPTTVRGHVVPHDM